MIRAGIFIGVDRSGDLQVLQDAAAGAERMYQWALTQGFTDLSHAKLITDKGGRKVRADDIYDAVKEVLDGAGVDQLLIYFAGHGVNINRSEQWLLSEAPVRASAAVDLTSNVELARYCDAVQHVVFISDACRVAPEGIQAQRVRGVDIFPNENPAAGSRPVDLFFACALGNTAAELKDPKVAANSYKAVYTAAFLDGLNGTFPKAVFPATEPGDAAHYVMPYELAEILDEEIPRRVADMNFEHEVNQDPDAIIVSRGKWLSRLLKPPAPSGPTAPAPSPAPPSPRPRGPRPRVGGEVLPAMMPKVTEVHIRTVDSGVAGAMAGLDVELPKPISPSAARVITRGAERIAAQFGPMHFETQCGIKVRGAQITDFFGPRVKGELLTPEILRVHEVDRPAASVLLRFSNGVGTVIPVLPEFIVGLTFDEGDLVDVSYEPSDNTWRWDMFKQQAAEVRALRAVAASSSRHGRFRLDRDDAFKIAQRMQFAKGIDPTLAVYAAYAYRDLQEIERIRHMDQYLEQDVGASFFDLALLARKLLKKAVTPNDNIVPFTPMLAQGWSLIRANRVRLHPALEGIEACLQESLWSLYDGIGIEKLHAALNTKEVR